MYEGQTYEVILQRMLDRVSNDVDKRPGSVIWDALAPAAAELAQMYIELDVNYNLSYADTATGDDLTRKTSEFGVNREPATKARRKGLFYASGDVLMDIPAGSRFSINDVNYTAVSKITTGQWTLECETAGTIGNQEFGALLPIDYINGLARAEITDLLVPGENEETDDALRARYYEAVNEPAFGGNVSDYEQFINAIDGVGATKVFPVWNGGGTVKCTIIGADWNPPSTALINDVQTKVDPVVNSGKGYGTAPIGHRVTITGVTDQPINVSTTVALEAGTTVGQVQGPIEDAISAYLLGLRQSWATQEQIIVRVALIEAAILNVSGVIDITNTMLNGSSANITLGAEEIPSLGTVAING
ncbi:baseplate J/gp47 family protein [Paenibacillus oralis]|uniref:Baseplate J/gp47 family protein n=1 Tax=Paenibacillus oralis TaxID=2490856 RepID=A0A3P3TX77_9BACL|nr:baseplate J/gp47 family protein [Paenibacillus oralis]RRJ62394.1 baseplate J/gp47 family protein [Paenibacillus oralis]